MRPTLVMAAVLAAAMPAVAHAVDLVAAVRAARGADPAYAAAQAAWAAGQTRRDQAAALWRPGVTLQGGAGLADSDSAVRGAAFEAPGFGRSTGVSFDTSIDHGRSTRWQAQVQQPLASGERSAQARALALGADAADFQWQSARQALVLRVAERYYDVALADATVGVLQRQREAVSRAAAEAIDRHRLGDLPVTDTHEATARREAIAAQVLAAQADADVKRQALADLTGLPADGLTADLPDERLSLVPPGGDAALPRWLEAAAQANPDLAVQRTQVAVAQAGVAGSGPWSGLSVDLVARLGRERLSGSGDFGGASATSGIRAVGVQVTMPLHEGGGRDARHREAVARADQARAEATQAARDVALRTRGVWLGLTVGARRVEALALALAATRARRDATQLARSVGDRTTLDGLNAENDVAQAELALAQARAHLLLDRLRLAALAGRLDEAALTAPPSP